MTGARGGILRLAAAALAVAGVLACAPAAGAASATQFPSVDPAFKGQAMWIWELKKVERGNLLKIAQRARANGITAVYVKAADGGTVWPQFSRSLVAGMKAAGLRICAWQFLYGRTPTAEANAGAVAVRNGAECLIADAESAYEGRYASARTYLKVLRKKVGTAYPLGMTSFPYVDYHPQFPYSVFLGNGGAQVNLPQVYWKDIGDKVDASMTRTWRLNRVYNRPIHPIGQLYQRPAPADVLRFRQLAGAYGAPGLSWWEWAAAPSRLWSSLGRNLGTAITTADPGWPVLGPKSKGDLVRRAQQLIAGSGLRLKATGKVDKPTSAAVMELQAGAGLPVTGTIDASTWQKLLKLPVTAPPAATVPAPAAPDLPPATPIGTTGGTPATTASDSTRYRGRTAEGRVVRLTVTAGRIADLRVGVSTFTCKPHGDVGPLSLHRTLAARIASGGGFGFTSGPASERLRVDGRVGRDHVIRGALQVRGTIGTGDPCHSPKLRFSAARVR